MLQQRHSKSKRITNESAKLHSQKSQSLTKESNHTFTTLAAHAKGRNRCGANEVANSTPAPNSNRRSPVNRNCNTYNFQRADYRLDNN